MVFTGQGEVLKEKPVPVPFCPPQNSQDYLIFHCNLYGLDKGRDDKVL
jgi:hypothetical protein